MFGVRQTVVRGHWLRLGRSGRHDRQSTPSSLVEKSGFLAQPTERPTTYGAPQMVRHGHWLFPLSRSRPRFSKTSFFTKEGYGQSIQRSGLLRTESTGDRNWRGLPGRPGSRWRGQSSVTTGYGCWARITSTCLLRGAKCTRPETGTSGTTMVMHVGPAARATRLSLTTPGCGFWGARTDRVTTARPLPSLTMSGIPPFPPPRGRGRFTDNRATACRRWRRDPPNGLFHELLSWAGLLQNSK